MNAPGKGLLKVVSILFIIFGAIATIISLIAVLGAAALTAYAGELAAVLMIGMILLLVVSVLELILGIVGLKKCGDPAKAGFFIVTGIVLCALSLLSIILTLTNGGTFDVTGGVGFILPILYIVGGSMNKKAAGETPVAS